MLLNTKSDLRLSSYVLFSIGNLKPLFQAAFPSCWDKHEICNPQWLNAVDYLEIVGIIVGQILVGVLGDWYEAYLDCDLLSIVSFSNGLVGLDDDGVSFRMPLSCYSA